MYICLLYHVMVINTTCYARFFVSWCALPATYQ
nr:MAG TPA: hypothetical protein [Caudoviricetes sp.]